MLWLYAPKRFRIIVVCAAFLVGIVLGSLFTWHVSRYWLYGGMGLLGISAFFRMYTVGLILGLLALLSLGYGLASQQLNRVTLSQPIRYLGRVDVESVQLTQPPKQRVILRIRDGPRAGAQFRLFTQNWSHDTGSQLYVQADIEPSQHTSDRGAAIIGSSIQAQVKDVIAPPGWFDGFRQTVQTRLGASLPEPYASLAVGLLTGAGDEFDASFKTDLQRTGTTHLVAVSGYNLTIVALFLQRLGQRRSRVAGYLLAIGSLGLYVLVAGPQASILRGAIVASFSLTAKVMGRIVHRLPLILMSAVVLSWLSPLGLLYSISWQLSFLAFVGIVFFQPLLEPLLQRWLKSVGATLAETISAQLMTLPLQLFQFGTLSVVALPVNAVVLGFVPLAMALSFLESILATVWVPLGRVGAWMTYPSLAVIIKPIQWASALPFAAYKLDNYSGLYFCLSYGGVGLLFLTLWYIYGRTKP